MHWENKEYAEYFSDKLVKLVIVTEHYEFNIML